MILQAIYNSDVGFLYRAENAHIAALHRLFTLMALYEGCNSPPPPKLIPINRTRKDGRLGEYVHE